MQGNATLDIQYGITYASGTGGTNCQSSGTVVMAFTATLNGFLGPGDQATLGGWINTTNSYGGSYYQTSCSVVGTPNFDVQLFPPSAFPLTNGYATVSDVPNEVVPWQWGSGSTTQVNGGAAVSFTLTPN